MGQRSGYKANRKSIAQKRREYREKVWREADVPPAWEDRLADKSLMREMLEKFSHDASNLET
jgi:hypothetical protein